MRANGASLVKDLVTGTTTSTNGTTVATAAATSRVIVASSTSSHGATTTTTTGKSHRHRRHDAVVADNAPARAIRTMPGAIDASDLIDAALRALAS
jgi:hypothetical protein